MFATSPTAYTPGKPVDREVGLHVDPPAAAGGRPGALRDRGRDSPPAQTTVRVGMRGAVVELDAVGVHRRDADAQADRRRRPWSACLCAYVVGLLGERAEQCVAAVDQVNRPRSAYAAVALQRRHQLGERPGRLDPGRAAADDDDVAACRRPAASSRCRVEQRPAGGSRSRSASATE